MKRAFEFLLLITSFVVLSPVVRAALPVFRAGQVLLPVFVAESAAPEERAAAEELGRVLGKISGLAWPVRFAALANERGFYVGRSPAGTERLKPVTDLFSPKVGEIGPDGFRIITRDGSVYIEGATPEATGFAVAWLLQCEGGVRWFVPGESGEKIPRRTEWTLPDIYEVRSPAYVSREISGLQTAEEQEWARRNGLGGRLNYSHALDRVFSADLFEQHLDWAPQFGAQRYRPVSADDQNWQPNLALPEVAKHAAQQAGVAFARDPALCSFSLGINDSMRFDESAATRAVVGQLRYFRRMPDYSPLVFSFMNRAAKSLARTNPDRSLGCLAYFWCENAPLFPVQSNVMPYVTTDRSQYYDREYRAADLALMARWGKSGVKAFGLWEYAYGRGFLVPRMALASLAESVREGWQQGARGYQAEVGPQWGFDAFKVWMLAQLMWEPNRSLEELAVDFYQGYYGAAAGPMRRFFARCEEQWMTQAGSPFWLKYYMQEDQVLLFPREVCQELRSLLTEAARLVDDDPIINERVERTSRAFAVTEAYQKLYAIRRILTDSKLISATDKEAALAILIRDLIQAEENFKGKIRMATKGALPAMTTVDIAAFVRNDPVPRLLWLAGQSDPDAPRRILDAARSDEASRDVWRILADVFADATLRAAPNLVANSLFATVAQEAQEPRFLYPRFGMLPARWKITAMPTETGKMELLEADSINGQRTLRIEGAWDTQVFQWIPAEPDCVYVATAKIRGTSALGNDSALYLTFLDQAGKLVGPVRMQAMPKGTTSDWRGLALADRAPDEAAWVGIGIGSTRQQPGDALEVATVELRGVITN